MQTHWLQLGLCALAIALAGSRLVRLADAIGERTGMSGSWIGLLLLSAVTSLPELATGISAVAVAQAPDIAIGDVLGSTVFNLALLAILDLLHRPEPLYRSASDAHVLSAAFGVVLLCVTGASILLQHEQALPALGSVGAYTPLLVVLYVLAMRIVYTYERRTARAEGPLRGRQRGHLGMRQLVLQFALMAVVVAVAGTWLPVAGTRIADGMGWSKSFVGTLLIASATSLPEVVVTLAALRLRALDMAIGGLLGSNLFDILIIAIDDAFYPRGPLLADVSRMHAVTAFSAAVMSGVVIAGLIYRPQRRLLRTMSVVGYVLLAVYAFSVYVLFAQRA